MIDYRGKPREAKGVYDYLNILGTLLLARFAPTVDAPQKSRNTADIFASAATNILGLSSHIWLGKVRPAFETL